MTDRFMYLVVELIKAGIWVLIGMVLMYFDIKTGRTKFKN